MITGSDIVKGDLSVVDGMYYIDRDDDLLEISYPLRDYNYIKSRLISEYILQ